MTSPARPQSCAVSPVYKGLNKPLTIWGVDRRLFFLALAIGSGTFNFFGSLAGGLLMFAALYIAARVSTAADPEMPRIVINSARLKTFYDPLKPRASRAFTRGGRS